MPTDPMFRRAPVARTRKIRGGFHMYRKIRYVGALRQVAVFASEGEPRVRGKRSRRNLPDSWDEHPLSTWSHHSWKRYRKTQYKVKKFAA